MDTKIEIYKQIFKNSFSIPVKFIFGNGEEYSIGQDNPDIAIIFNNPIFVNPLKNDIILFLAEAYIHKYIEVNGSLQELIVSAFENKNSFLENKKYKLLNL